MYPLGTWFVSGICVWIPCIKETMMIMVMMMMIIIIIMDVVYLSLHLTTKENGNYVRTAKMEGQHKKYM